jgi:mRNA interferase MazF
MNQGDIYLVNLDQTICTEASKIRPCIILSVNTMNRYSPRIIVAPITSIVGKVYPFEIFIQAGIGGLKKDSKIMLDQIRSLDKKRLVKKIGVMDKELLIKACSIAQRLISPE